MEFALESADSRNCHVEISGWDSSDSFFVEKAMLQWGVDGKKEIRFHSAVRRGCIVFVRMLQPAFDSAIFPIAYRADVVESDAAGGQTLMRLTRLHPRAAFKEVAANFAPSESMVA